MVFSLDALLPEELTPLWTAYYSIVVFSLTVQVISVIALSFAAVAACYNSCKRIAAGIPRVRTTSEPIAAIVPCYLPNEAPIIEATITHLMTKLSHVESLDVHVVYNTPNDLPIEATLKGMMEAAWPSGRRLFVQRVHGSKSKAENLNFVIPQISAKYLVIYDADHHPDPNSLALAIRRMEESNADCVQGSTYIRQGCCLGRILVNCEFFIAYFAVLPMMQQIAGTGFFGGANGIWRTASIQQFDFDHDALTEDIDIFTRSVMSKGFVFEFMPECASGELLPSSLGALWKQRLRWAMGWDQCTLKYVGVFWKAKVSLRKRIGLYYIFVCRWFTQLCAVVIILVNTTPALKHIFLSEGEDQEAEDQATKPDCIIAAQKFSLYLFNSFIAFVFVRALVREPSVHLIVGLVLYFMCMPVYMLFGSVLIGVSLLRITSGNTGTWEVTSRAGGPAANALGADARRVPLLGVSKSETSRLSKFVVLALGFVSSGAVAGLYLGTIVGRHIVKHPMWGWVPFGIGETRTVEVDGRMVRDGFFGGIAVAMALLSVIILTVQLRKV